MLMAIGDFHLGCLSSYVPTLYKLQLRQLKNVLDFAVERDIEHVFMLGDVFDTPSPSNMLQIALRRLLSNYPDLFIHIIIGNHDWESTEHHALQMLHDYGATKKFNFKVYTKPKVIRVDGVRLFICPHPYIMDAPSKKIDWCLGHFGWNNAVGDNGHRVASDNSPRGRWLLGDFHPHQHGSRYVYCGSLTQIKWDEQLPKGVVLFDQEDWEFKPFDTTYKLGTMKLESAEDLSKLDESTLWSIEAINGYTLPADYKQKYHNIVHIRASKRRRDERAAVLLANDESILHKPIRIVRDYLHGHRLDLTNREIKLGIHYAKRILASIAR